MPNPFTEFHFDPFVGAMDLAFDGLGNVAGGRVGSVILVTSTGEETELAGGLAPPLRGMRFTVEGDLVVSEGGADRIVRITPEGDVSDLASGLDGSVWGLYPDFEGRVWFTDRQSVRRVDPGGAVVDVVTGPDATDAAGVVYDPDRGLLLYTSWQNGAVYRVPIDAQGEAGTPEVVVTLEGGPGIVGNGLALDACGHLYYLDPGVGLDGEGALKRQRLDAAGEAVGAPELLFFGDALLIDAMVFANGPGFDQQSLYFLTGGESLWSLDVGVAGKPYPP